MALIPHAGQAGRPSDRGLGALQVIRASDRDAILIVATGAQALDRIAKLWDLPPTGNRVEFEFIDIFRVSDDKLI